jgi:hypothetical protein
MQCSKCSKCGKYSLNKLNKIGAKTFCPNSSSILHTYCLSLVHVKFADQSSLARATFIFLGSKENLGLYKLKDDRKVETILTCMRKVHTSNIGLCGVLFAPSIKTNLFVVSQVHFFDVTANNGFYLYKSATFAYKCQNMKLHIKV